MQLYQTTTPNSIDNSRDRQNLALLRKRFGQINTERLRRTRLALDHRQAVFLDALPLLFHCNHPMLPGFVSHSTPAGISGFKPNKADLTRGKTLARSFRITGERHDEALWGIYLMGSMGTLAQSTHSDFDVWLCHEPGLSKEALTELQQKCQRISQWAKTLRLEAHFFLMDCDSFRAGGPLSLDDESSGSAQRFLLLDEFYRTALHIAGRVPLWWFTASQDEQNYESCSRELLDKRFLRPDTTLDFGSMSRIPEGEFIGAGIWQLYKAIASPYKSVLKLLLMEVYVYDFPNTRPLSLDYKQLVYEGEFSINELDPYMMVYRRIERYLRSQGDVNRLELARRCLYFKVNKRLSKPPSRRSHSWQRILLERLVQEWGWSSDYVHILDQRVHWKSLQVKQERSQLVRALDHSYQILLDFAQRSGAARAISSRELSVLGRKLSAAFENRPGKLEWVNPGISEDLTESQFTFVTARTIAEDTRDEQTVWQLYGNETGAETPLRQADSPVELLLWCHANGIMDGHVHFDVKRAPSTSEGQLRRALSRLQQWLPLPIKSPPHHTFDRVATPEHVLMLINVAAEAEQGHRLSHHIDPLRYGHLSENLVASVDLAVQNSWQEITCQRFTGNNALLSALQAYLALCTPGGHQAPPSLQVECLGASRATLIAQRVRQWLREITACYYTGTKPPATRYVFEMGNAFYSFQFKGSKQVLLAHKNRQQLLHYLGEPQRRYSPLVIDSYALLNHPVKLIARRASSRAINVFFQRQQEQLEVYVVDERGSLVGFHCQHTPRLNALNSLHVFLRSVLARLRHKSTIATECGVYTIKFHELKEDALRHLVLSPRVVTPDPPQSLLLSLRAVARCNDRGQFAYDFYCEGRSFLWQELQQDVFYATAQFILQQRQSHERYPVFITDLDLEQCSEQLSSTQDLQISHYLRIKNELENTLSAALSNRT